MVPSARDGTATARSARSERRPVAGNSRKWPSDNTEIPDRSPPRPAVEGAPGPFSAETRAVLLRRPPLIRSFLPQKRGASSRELVTPTRGYNSPATGPMQASLTNGDGGHRPTGSEAPEKATQQSPTLGPFHRIRREWTMGFPRIPARRGVAAATVVAAAAMLVIVSLGNTRAAERESPELADGSPNGTAAVSLSNRDICSRSSAARTAIISMMADLTAGRDVTEQHLADASGTLDLYGQSLTSLRAGDLDVLSGITKVDISGNDLDYLPSHIFDDLTSVEEIDVSDNALEPLPPGEFKHTASPSLNQRRFEQVLSKPSRPCDRQKTRSQFRFLFYNHVLVVCIHEIRGPHLIDKTSTPCPFWAVHMLEHCNLHYHRRAVWRRPRCRHIEPFVISGFSMSVKSSKVAR